MLKNLQTLKTFQTVQTFHLPLVILSLYLLFGAISLISSNIHFDEKEFHLPTLVTFHNENPINVINSRDYKSASTPLPYLLVSTVLKVFNLLPTLITARLANIVLSILCLIIFLKLFGIKGTNIVYPALILFFYPYFLKPSFAFFMSIYGLFFFLLFIYFTNKNGSLNKFISGIFLALAILSQQFYLIVFFFYMIFLWYNDYHSKKNIFPSKDLILFSIPLIVPLILFYFWGGLTHHNFSARAVNFRFENLTSVLIISGSALFPFLIFKIQYITRIKLAVILSISMVLVLFASPLWVNAPTVGGISGYTFHSIAIINEYNSILTFIIKVSLCFLGISSLLLLYKTKGDTNTRLLYFLFITMIVGFSMSNMPSERHMLPLIALGYLLAISYDIKVSILRLWLGIQVIIGSGYFYYIMFVYQG